MKPDRSHPDKHLAFSELEYSFKLISHFTTIEGEMNKQMHSMPEAEVIEWLAQHGYSFEEAMEFKRDLKGDCIWKCWN